MTGALPSRVQVDRASQDEVEMIEFALPVPSDHREKVRALTYLHDTIDYYIKDFCDGEQDIEIPLGDGPAAYGPPPVKPYSVTLPQAVQIFLTFYICLFI